MLFSKVQELKPLHALLLFAWMFTEITKSKAFMIGHFCTTGGIANLPGVCKPIVECSSALSNFRAGINPPICYVEDVEPLICCPTQKRISETKCEEYVPKIREAFSVGGDVSSSKGCFSNRKNKISGGRDAEPEEMSYMAALGYSDEDNNDIDWKCGGTLISEQYVLSAAHCLLTSKPPTHVLLGIKNLRDQVPNRILARIEKIYIHPDYNRPTKYHDLGLIKLDRQLTFSQYIYPACLPQPSKRLELINETLTAGWGRLEYFGNRAETLQVTTLKRYNMKECNAMYTEGSPDLRLPLPEGFMKSQICAGDMLGRADSCDGDSGGPLIVRENMTDCTQFVVGITSFGDHFCGSGIPAVYTNVQSYLDWIEFVVWGGEQ